MIAGPAVGGLIYAVSPVLVYSLCCLLYVSASLLIGMVRAGRTATSREPISMAVLFASAAGLAALVPAYRATCTNPIEALRVE